MTEVTKNIFDDFVKNNNLNWTHGKYYGAHNYIDEFNTVKAIADFGDVVGFESYFIEDDNAEQLMTIEIFKTFIKE